MNLKPDKAVLFANLLRRDIFLGGKTAMLQRTIHTDRLTLRPPRLSDAAEIFARYAADPQVTRYMSWTVNESVTETEAFLADVLDMSARGELVLWVITCRQSRKICGTISLRFAEPTATLGYCLARDCWGKGFATEAADAVVPQAWREPGIERLEAYCCIENARSARVLEKVGLHFTGVAKRYVVCPALGPEPQDMLRFAMRKPVAASSFEPVESVASRQSHDSSSTLLCV